MSRERTAYRCQACGSPQARWSGRCTSCGQWNSVEEQAVLVPLVVAAHKQSSWATELGGAGGPGGPGPEVLALDQVDLEAHPPMATGLSEVDRVLAGGLLPGSATLLGGEPGTGKSTLLLQLLASMAGAGRRCLLVAAEEAAHQVRRRASRLGADVAGVYVIEGTQLPAIEAAVAHLAPEVVVVDSVQAVNDPDLGPSAGSPAQVRECAHRLVAIAKACGAALLLVGHVTKEGALAGPRTLEHLVDTVLSFEGDRYLSLRSLKAVKHRFGPTGETGLFEMGETGLTGVADPSTLFLGDRRAGAAGSAVTVPIEGHRPLLVEVQALVGRLSPVPRRSVTGVDPSRVALLVAVLDRAGAPVGQHDVYVSVAGGARAAEPAADLAICLALASSASKCAVPGDLVAVGEVDVRGLTAAVLARLSLGGGSRWGETPHAPRLGRSTPSSSAKARASSRSAPWPRPRARPSSSSASRASCR